MAAVLALAGSLGAQEQTADTVVKLTPVAASTSLLQGPAEFLETGDYDIAATPPAVHFAVLPGQWAGARLWSSWGDSVLASDGNHYLSIGDHASPHGSALVYKFNPTARTVEQVIDVNAVLGIPKDQYAPGKIHGPLVDTGDGAIRFITYRGSVSGTTATSKYQGDSMLRYDLASGQTVSEGIPLPHASGVVARYHAATNRLYGLAVPGRTMEPMVKQFFVYDLTSRRLLFCGGPEPAVTRAMFLCPDGRAFYDIAGAELAMYDPGANQVVPTGLKLPGDQGLRAAGRVMENGQAVGITYRGQIFLFDTRKMTLEPIAATVDSSPTYTAVCRLDSTGRYLYYVPGSHGGTSRIGTPVMQLDLQTGRRKVLTFLNAAVREQFKYNLGGSFGTSLAGDDSQLVINFNGAPVDQKKPEFGLCSVVLIDIPASERMADEKK